MQETAFYHGNKSRTLPTGTRCPQPEAVDPLLQAWAKAWEIARRLLKTHMYAAFRGHGSPMGAAGAVLGNRFRAVRALAALTALMVHCPWLLAQGSVFDPIHMFQIPLDSVG